VGSALWNLFKVALKSPYVALVAAFTLFLGFMTAMFSVGLVFSSFEMAAGALEEGGPLKALLILGVSLLSGALFTLFPAWLTRAGWDTFKLRAEGVREDLEQARESAREAGVLRAQAAEDARRARDQGGMLTVSEGGGAGGELSQVSRADDGLELFDEGVVLGGGEEEEDDEVAERVAEAGS
jgi:hypothetical protein